MIMLMHSLQMLLAQPKTQTALWFFFFFLEYLSYELKILS